MAHTFAVVIPTRNRAAYLEHSLRTCTIQADLLDEIIVCDNSDSSQSCDVQSLVKRLDNPKIRYVRPPSPPLSMTDNWNFALSFTRSDYTTIIGDDDGLLPFCVEAASMIAAQSNADAIRWNWAHYFWPSFKYGSQANTGCITFPQTPWVLNYRKVDTKKLLNKVINGKAWYIELPMLYNSFVHKDVLNRIKKDGNSFLEGQCPDIYSGIAVAASSKIVVSTNYPLAVAGQGSSANGAAFFYEKQNSTVSKDFSALNQKYNRSSTIGAIDLGTIAAHVTDCFRRFESRFPVDCLGVKQQSFRLADWQSKELALAEENVEERNRIRMILEEHFKGTKGATERIRSNFRNLTPKQESPHLPGFRHESFYFTGKCLRSSNIFEICTSLGEIVGTPTRAIESNRVPWSTREAVNQFVPPAILRGLRLARTKIQEGLL